ncbi:hypothetical protein NQ315_016889 [Exocentrus adspersus]|uniref:Uncharacterized protein n=1 Tax=Exocentrus adspersus TaxID=1586481 RepID=A0AAV8VXN3_9CUCU|nr:hypothetical protein NQ315_016889 [Exocentrus adspersus]
MKVNVLLFIITVAVYLTVGEVEEVKVLKKHSYYKISKERVTLRDVGLKQIELEAFKDATIRELIIIGNPLKEIRKGVFVNLSTHEVYLEECDISKIEAGAFHELHPLESYGIYYLSLSRNKLETIKKGVFTGTKFRKLILSYNKIATVEAGAFDGMVHLLEVDLEMNLLSKIGVGVFQNIPGPNRWVDLVFRSNRIKHIDPYAFENTTINNLYLDGNQLGTVSQSYFRGSTIGSLIS